VDPTVGEGEWGNSHPLKCSDSEKKKAKIKMMD
jgi:hypothetical protein